MKNAAFVVLEGSVIMMKVYLKVDSVRVNAGISFKNLHIQLINAIKIYY